jgi:hypothetical protein
MEDHTIPRRNFGRQKNLERESNPWHQQASRLGPRGYIPTKASGSLNDSADVCLANKWNGDIASSVSRHITIRLGWDIPTFRSYINVTFNSKAVANDPVWKVVRRQTSKIGGI